MLSYVVCDVHHVSWLVNEQVFGASRRSTAIEKVKCGVHMKWTGSGKG